ncbi:MAG: SDR family NAD(P)-dependent oxidoreductase [Anaerolineales bacterium]|jgi:NAD(P)-dependent dehydrogenase (short-subunit alcohol dehydrogenase family)
MSALDGKVAVITGAGSGIGQAAAQLFSDEGAQVIILEIDTDSASQTLTSFNGPHPGSSHILDVTDAPQVASAVKSVVCDYGRIDVLVNVAGGSGRKWGDGPTDACTIEGWHKTIALNLDSLFYCCKYALQQMLTQEKGAIVNISSVLGLVGGDDDFATHAYAASKGGIISLTRSIASYYAPRGIRANVICPGLIATSMSKRAQESENIRTRLPQLQPLTGDFGSPKDVARAALYLASDASSFVTGAVLTVDGGWTVR